MIRIGIIGYGGRVRGMYNEIDKLGADTELVAITDVRNDEIKQQLQSEGKSLDNLHFYTDPDEMLDNEALDGVMIGTRCSLHTQMAIKVLSRDIPLFLEKPVATNMDDLLALKAAGCGKSDNVVVSFPLRVTPLVKIAKDIINSGKLGTIEHVQSWNNVPYGACYYQSWYRDADEIQGLFLQKATHDFDYINYLLGTQPQWISAMASKRVYKGDHPAGLKCDECSEWDSCLESPFHTYLTKQETDRVRPSGLLCGFAVDAQNEDSGSALIQYESGMHVSYSQNFFARKSAGARGARLFGYKGTLEFDWYTGDVKVFMHHSPLVETYSYSNNFESHNGGDSILADNFVRVMRRECPSISPLDAGLLSTLMCLKAKESASTQTFQKIEYPC